MSHLTLLVRLSTDGDDFATQAADDCGALVASQLRLLADRVESRGSSSGSWAIRDINGNRVGPADLSQVL